MKFDRWQDTKANRCESKNSRVDSDFAVDLTIFISIAMIYFFSFMNLSLKT